MDRPSRQLVFIDDSGDPGFKLDKGSSSHFVIACVIFDDPLDAEEAALIIKKYKRELKFAQYREFKFNKTRKDYVEEILRRLHDVNYTVRAICIDKKLIRSDELRNRQDSFYNFAIKEVLAKSSKLSEAKVRLDGHAGREYKKSATTYLRRELNACSKKIAKVRFVDSKTDNLIQLADLIAGSILRSTQSEKTDQNTYLNILKHGSKIDDIWDFR